jgi:hypothetical protein
MPPRIERYQERCAGMWWLRRPLFDPVLLKEAFLKEGVTRHEPFNVLPRVTVEDDQPAGPVDEGTAEVSMKTKPPPVGGVVRCNHSDSILVVLHEIEVKKSHRRLPRGRAPKIVVQALIFTTSLAASWWELEPPARTPAPMLVPRALSRAPWQTDALGYVCARSTGPCRPAPQAMRRGRQPVEPPSPVSRVA